MIPSLRSSLLEGGTEEGGAWSLPAETSQGSRAHDLPLHPRERRWSGPHLPIPHRPRATVDGDVRSPLLQFPSPPIHALLLDLVGSIHRFQALVPGNMWNLIAHKVTHDCSIAPPSSGYPECNLVSRLLMRTHSTSGQHSDLCHRLRYCLGLC